jgi:hypothetical protein
MPSTRAPAVYSLAVRASLTGDSNAGGLFKEGDA